MTDADVWLILDSGVAVSRVAYASPAAAERDAEVLRAEASDALGYALPDGQIEVYGVQIVDLPIYGLTTAGAISDCCARAAIKDGAGQDVDPFAAPPGYRPPARGGVPQPNIVYRYDALEEIDPFAPPGRQSRLKGDEELSRDSSDVPVTSQAAGSRQRRHLTLVR